MKTKIENDFKINEKSLNSQKNLINAKQNFSFQHTLIAKGIIFFSKRIKNRII